jgi:Ca2+-binding RTX toxin-like protein
LSGVVLDGGEGSNLISLTLWSPLNRPDEHHSWKIDNRAGQMVRDGEVVARVSGFLDFDLQVKGPLRFVGSDLAETLDFTVLPPPEAPLGSDPVRRNWPLLLDMHGGDDEVAYSRGGPDSRFDGGDGTDRFSFWADWFPGTMVYLNLATGTLRYIRGGPGAGTHVVGFENVRWWSGADATIIGTAGPNKIVTRLHSPDRDVIVHGKRGDDTMRTGDGKDILIGGRGHDVADGGARFDHCEAEVRTHCES